jgi:hypothetical protein
MSLWVSDTENIFDSIDCQLVVPGRFKEPAAGFIHVMDNIDVTDIDLVRRHPYDRAYGKLDGKL